MKTRIPSVMALGVSCLAAWSAHAVLYDATLTWTAPNGTTIFANPTGDPKGWDKISTSLRYQVDNVGGAYPWQYTYTWTTGTEQKALSHIVIEVSASATAADFTGLAGAELGSHGESNGNPGIPSTIYGLKWDTTGDPTTLTVSFLSKRAPTWGDFFAKDGDISKKDVYAYNAGLSAADTDPDPSVYALTLDPSVTKHILVPDTRITISDSGATLVLLGCGLLALGTFRRPEQG